MKKILLVLALASLTSVAMAQTYSGYGMLRVTDTRYLPIASVATGSSL